MDEKFEILKLLEEGKITVIEAKTLLKKVAGENLLDIIDNICIEDLDIYNSANRQADRKIKSEFDNKFFKTNKTFDKKMLHINILSFEKDKMHLTFPISLATLFLEASRGAMENLKEKIDLEYINYCILNEIEGRILSVESNDGDKIVVEIA